MPASRRAAAVPPVETISTSSAARPRAKSTTPVLSETESSARRTRTSSPAGAAPSVPADGTTGSAIRRLLRLVDAHETRILGIRADGAGRDQADRLGQQLMLDLVNRALQLRAVARVWHLDCALQDDRARVDALVDEVDSHARDPHPLGQR